jgi:O-antigen ligase
VKNVSHIDTKLKLPVVAMCALLAIVAMFGGSARADVQSLIILRPLSVLLLGYGFWGISDAQIGSYRFIYVMAGAVVLLVVAHLVPLPPEWWQHMAGRDLIAEIDDAAQLGYLWRPLSMNATGTWNAFFALSAPLAALALMTRLNSGQMMGLLTAVLLLGCVSAILGLLQVVTGGQGTFYTYDMTNNGTAVGLFANRNHQAAMIACMFPMLAVFAGAGVIEPSRRSMVNWRGWIAMVGGLALVPLLLITGSRAGLVLSLIGIAFVPALLPRASGYSAPRKSVSATYWLWAVSVLVIAALVALTVYLSRAEAIDRALTRDVFADQRMTSWPTLLAMVGQYMPWGSGIGTFPEVYQIEEPYALLSQAYVNHAHNDWLESALTGGLPAIALMTVALIAYFIAAYQTFWKSDRGSVRTRYSRLGLALIMILGVASLVDYPLRTPMLSVLFVIALFWSTLSLSTSRTTPQRMETLA